MRRKSLSKGLLKIKNNLIPVKKKHTSKIQLLINASTKMILHLAFALGSVHDFKLYQTTSVQLPDNVNLLADSGYQSLENLHESSYTPYKKTKNKELTDFQKKVNQELAKQRVCVENVIREIKIFRILGCKYRNRNKNIEKRASLISAFVNYHKSTKYDL